MLKFYIVTIPIPGKDLTTLQNFDLILLLNLDVKLYAKLIATCLLDIPPTLIKPDQFGFTEVDTP